MTTPPPTPPPTPRPTHLPLAALACSLVAILGCALSEPASAPTNEQPEPAAREEPTPAPVIEQAPDPAPAPTPVQTLAPEPEPKTTLDSTPEPTPEPPVPTEPDAPAWWLTSIRQESDHTLIPGTADAPTLRAARDAALAAARADAMRLALDDTDETVLHAASATLDDATFRYWTVIRYEHPKNPDDR